MIIGLHDQVAMIIGLHDQVAMIKGLENYIEKRKKSAITSIC